MLGETCCTYTPVSDSSDETFMQAMNQLKEQQDETHCYAGQDPNRKIDIDLSGVGTLFNKVESIFGSACDWMKDTFGSLGATIMGWILKVMLGLMICCMVACCGKVCSGTITKVVEKQLVFLGPMEVVESHDLGIWNSQIE